MLDRTSFIFFHYFFCHQFGIEGWISHRTILETKGIPFQISNAAADWLAIRNWKQIACAIFLGATQRRLLFILSDEIVRARRISILVSI